MSTKSIDRLKAVKSLAARIAGRPKSAEALKREQLLAAMPESTKVDNRVCFALYWYDTEAKADEAARIVGELGYTINGGWLNGMPCGRAPEHDYVDKELKKKLYAVTQ